MAASEPTSVMRLTRDQRDAFCEGVGDLLCRLRTDDLDGFDADPWGVIRQLSACMLVLDRLAGDPRADSYELTVTPEIREVAIEVSRYSRIVLDDCRVDMQGRPGPAWSEEDRQEFAAEARRCVDGYLDQLVSAEQVRTVA